MDYFLAEGCVDFFVLFFSSNVFDLIFVYKGDAPIDIDFHMYCYFLVLLGVFTIQNIFLKF